MRPVGYLLSVWLLTLFLAPFFLMLPNHPAVDGEFLNAYAITMTSNILLSIPVFFILILILYFSPYTWSNIKLKTILCIAAVLCIFGLYWMHDSGTLDPKNPMFHWPLLHSVFMIILIFVFRLKRT